MIPNLQSLKLDITRYQRCLGTLPETNIAHENPIFPGKYHQNGGIFHGYVSFRECNTVDASEFRRSPPGMFSKKKPVNNGMFLSTSTG